MHKTLQHNHTIHHHYHQLHYHYCSSGDRGSHHSSISSRGSSGSSSTSSSSSNGGGFLGISAAEAICTSVADLAYKAIISTYMYSIVVLNGGKEEEKKEIAC